MIRRAACVAAMAIVLSLGSAISQAQTETGLPGSAFAGVVPGPDGRFYGVTYDGGTSNMGTLYSVDAGLLTATVHVNFDGTNGKTAYDELTYDSATGRFYGVTERGGVNDQGTVFSYVPGAGSVTTLRQDFSGHFGVVGPLVLSGGFIYGAVGSNIAGNGSIFRMATDGSGFTIIHDFTQFSQRSYGLTLGPDGRLYGVTIYGGIVCQVNQTLGCGTLFRLKAVLPGDTNTQFQTLYDIQNLSDAGPQRTVTYGSDGLIYFNNHRRIFRLDPNNPAATFQVIWDEPGGSVSMSVIEGSDSRLYIASYDNNQSSFAGSVFTIKRDGTDKQVLRLFSFTTGSTAYGPYGRLYRTPSGTVYGTTEYTVTGFAHGTVFALNAGSNSPPVLSNVTATSPIIENGTTTLSGTITDPNASDTFILTVNWGDGSGPQSFNYPAGTTSFSETHQYVDDNPTGTPSDNYAIGLTVSDNNGGVDTDLANVTVNNAAPVLSNVTANPSIIIAGQSTTFSGNVSDVGTLDPHDIKIDWGDGSPNTVLNLGPGVNSFNTTHQYNSIGTFNIVVTATDDDTGSATSGAVLTVNSPPVLSNVAITSPITENGTANLTGNISDANPGDTFSLAVNWGDGSPVQFFGYQAGTTSFNETHQYLDDNPTATASDSYTISLVLSDGHETDTGGTLIVVNNAAPGLINLAANPSTINVGGITNVSGTVTDAGAFDSHQVVIVWGDGTPNTTINLAVGVVTFNANHQYNASGNFSVVITASDDDTGTVTSGTNVIVNSSPQVPPVLSNVMASSIIENGTTTLTGNITDPNAGDTFTLMVDWGDGSPPETFNFGAGTTVFALPHQYLDDNPTATPADQYTINLTLSDNAGGSDTDTATLTVTNAVPALSNVAARPSAIVVGSSTTVTGDVTDIGTLDTHQIVIDWGDGTASTTLNLPAGVSGFSSSHQYVAAGTFNIAVTATDDDTGSTGAGTGVTVAMPGDGKIAFASARDGNYEIYSMNPDGSNQTRLTTNSAQDYYPAISPDGNRIVFGSNRDGNYEIYIMNADGTGQTRLTNHQQHDIMPEFSPDGTRIVFTSYRNGNIDVWVMEADGANPTRLTNNANPDFEPVFSPDGSKIAFTSQRDGYGQVYLMNADGTNQTRLTSAVADEYDPSFSPDGTRIAFSSFRNGPQVEIYAMNADGSNQTRLTNSAAAEISASYSPDGNRIAFVSNRDGRLEVYVMNSDGTNQVRLTNNPQGNEYPSFGSFPAPSGKIVFASNRDTGTFDFEIYSMNTNGTNPTRLTNNPAVDYGPAMSPDGTRIAFHSDRDGNAEIYVMNSDGTGQTRLTNNPAFDTYPAFSADGTRIAFMSFRDGNTEIYVMNADGTNQTRLTNNAASDVRPSFSGDGSLIAFQSDRDGNSEIYVMNPDGTNPTRLTNNSASDSVPNFSPDGMRIVFSSNRDGVPQIYRMDTAGTNQVRLSNGLAADTHPAFSPDGTQIAFTTNRNGGGGEIYRMNADGTNPTRLTSNPADDVFPSWGNARVTAPGRKIVFESERDGNPEIYSMNSNGTNQVRLTNNPAIDRYPTFSPDGTRIAFASRRDGGDFDIFLANADGTNLIQLTNNTTDDIEPSFSPNGARILFTAYRDGNAEIYVMNADGTGQSRLTNNTYTDGNPTFSPDGNRIAFAIDRGSGYEIFLMNANGSNQSRLTSGYEPSFSPDGARIAFTEFPPGVGIFIINVNGANRVRLTSNSSDLDPAFSPDGNQIAFESGRDGTLQVYLMNSDGSNQTRLTNNAAKDSSPAWGGLVLAAPTNLTAVAVSTSQINLAWTDNSIGEDGFAIERCDGNGKCSVFVRIAGTGANTATFANTGLRPATFYTYRVKAFSASGDSPYSNTARDKTKKP